MRWEEINACQRVSFYLFIYLFSRSSFDDTALGLWLMPGVCAVALDPSSLRWSCMSACVVLFTDGPQGRLSGPESVFASCSRIISRRRPLAGGCSDCQKRLKSSNLESVLESVVFRGIGENWWADGLLSLSQVWVWVKCLILLFYFYFLLQNHQSWRPWWTSENFPIVCSCLPINHRQSDAPVVHSTLHSRALFTAVLLIL